MAHKLALIVLLFLIVISPQLAACAGGPPVLPVKEADFSVRDQQSFWLDNTHVLFYGYTGSEGVPGKDFHYLNEGLYVWDIERGTVTKDARFEHAHPECINSQTKSYVLRYSTDGETAKRQALVDGREVVLPDQSWVNPISCRVSTTKPAWVLARHADEKRATVPLLEEHGYLDRGIYGDDYRKNFPLLFYRAGVEQPTSLGLGSGQVERDITYYPFVDAYLLHGNRNTYKAPPLWLLRPNGTVEQIFNPEGKAWADKSWSWLVLTKQGPVFASLHSAGPHAADAGLYLWKEGVLTRVGGGFFSLGVVSPDGCKLAFINDRRDLTLPTEKRYRLQVMNVCEGGENVN